MSELFEDDEDKMLIVDDSLHEEQSIDEDRRPHPTPDARRRLEHLMDEKRLQNELDDFLE